MPPRLTPVAPLPMDDGPQDDDKPVYNTVQLVRRLLNPLSQIQKYSAYTFGVFLGIHACLVILVPSISEALVSPELKQEVFEMARAVYRLIPLFEPLCVFGAAAIHVTAGIAIRIVRRLIKPPQRASHPAHTHLRHTSDGIVVDETNKDIGLGGIQAILGFGYRKAMISRWIPGLSPLAFSGYVLLPLALYHIAKFRYMPVVVDGDASLVSLDFIPYYLNVLNWGPRGNHVNFAMLIGLVWTMAYHAVGGWMRFNRKFSLRWKKIAYGVINGVTVLALISVYNFRERYHLLEKAGYFARAFTAYASACMW